MRTTAAILVETSKPLMLVELEIPLLRSGQVLVEIIYSGVCRTQILECQGHRGEDRYLPHCLGHEGSGIVREVGRGVTKVKPGDRVILSWIKGSGADVPGTIYGWGGRSVNAGAVTTFSNHSVVSENRLTIISDLMGFKSAALLGCAIPTGVGAVLNTARPRPGQGMAVFGVGGIGLHAVNAAKIAGCVPIIAVDILQNKLELAKTMGADHCVTAFKFDSVKVIQDICPGGVDFAIECSGRPGVMLQALSSVRDQGGTAVIVGNARHGERVHLDPYQLNQGKRLLGTWGGDNWPDRDYPRYVRLFNAGSLKIPSPMLMEYPLSEINEAIGDLEEGKTIRPLINMKME